MTVTEIAILPFKDGERPEDATSAAGKLMQEQLSYILKSAGVQRCYWGRAIELPDLIYLLVDWNTVEDHTNFLRDLTADAPDLSKLLSRAPVMYHATLIPFPPRKVLSKVHSPVTEIVTFYFAADFPEASYDKISSDTETFRNALEAPGGCNASAGGWILEQVDLPNGQGKGRAFVMVIGWDSVDAHIKFLEDPIVQKHVPLIIGLPGVVGRDMCHVSLTEF